MSTANNESHRNIAFLIIAKNEEKIIESTISSINPQLHTGDTVILVADNCTDSTEKKAKENGAFVVSRKAKDLDGKGQALKWFVKDYFHLVEKFAAVIILDADSKLVDGFVKNVRDKLGTSNTVFQCTVQPTFDISNRLENLLAYSEIIDQAIGDRFRSAMGWTVRLRGTGMVIPPKLLWKVAPEIRTNTEDIALSLLFASRSISIRRIDDAIVLDPKPRSLNSAADQRARWFRGQIQALYIYWKEIISVLLHGPGGWNFLASIFLKPKWLWLTIYIVLAILFKEKLIVSGIFFSLFLLGLLPYLLGIFIVPEKIRTLLSFIFFPKFVWMWGLGLLRSLSADDWLRTKED